MKETAPALAGYDRPREHIDRGIIETVEYASETVGNFRKATIYTPPGYGDDKTYNVLYLLHGIRRRFWIIYARMGSSRR